MYLESLKRFKQGTWLTSRMSAFSQSTGNPYLLTVWRKIQIVMIWSFFWSSFSFLPLFVNNCVVINVHWMFLREKQVILQLSWTFIYVLNKKTLNICLKTFFSAASHWTQNNNKRVCSGVCLWAKQKGYHHSSKSDIAFEVGHVFLKEREFFHEKTS